MSSRIPTIEAKTRTATGDSAAHNDVLDPIHPRHKHLTAHSTWQGRGRTDIEVRGFVVPTGEPEKVGGDNSAPTPMEVILAALEGCLTVVIETLAAEQEHTLSSVAIDSHAVMDVRGFEGVPGVRPYYETVEATVELALDIDAGQLPAFGRAAEDRCPALTLFRAAAVDVTVKWVLI